MNLRLDFEIMLRLTTFLLMILLANAQEYEYEYEEHPESVLGYLMKEAVNQLTTTTGQAPIEKEESLETTNEIVQDSSASLFTALKEKLFEINESDNEVDPVYNFIMWFSAIALFFQAFYTPFGKTTIGRKKRGLTEW